MLQRKFTTELSRFLQEEPDKIMLVNGARQIGKSYLIRYVSQQQFAHYIEINLQADKEGARTFANVHSVQDFYVQLGIYAGQDLGNREDTIVFLDEIQAYPHLLTLLKFLNQDARYRYIASGSQLGIALKMTPSTPMGSIAIKQMYPLDFEEFLWANGLNQDVIEALRKCYKEETPVPAGIHVAMKNYLNLYVAIGGLPAPINAFLATNNMNAVSEEYQAILEEYRDDMVKYAPDKDKPHIRECFNSIPKQLAKENKKFQYSKVMPGGRGEAYAGSLQWLEDAGIISRCYNTDITGLPMEGNARDNVFKVYTADIGLLIAMLAPGTRADILQGNLGGFKGAIFENLMADTLHKKRQNLYYFQKDSGLELDFLVRMKGECVPLEVKARTSQAKSAQTVLKHPEKYGVKQIIKFGDYNVGREGQLLTLPSYMQFLLDLEPEETVLEPIDVNAVNAQAKEFLSQ